MPDLTNSKTKPQGLFPERVSAESRQFALWLDKNRSVYFMFGALDGLNCASALYKVVIDLCCSDSASSSDMMHDTLMTPEGIAAAAASSLVFIVFAALANYYTDKEKNAIKYFIVMFWVDFRNAFKALKNAYRGVRCTIQALKLVAHVDLRYLIVPVGIALGILSIINRVCTRKYIDAPRKKMTALYEALLLEVKATKVHLLDALPASENIDYYKNSYIFVGQKLYYVYDDGQCEEIENRGDTNQLQQAFNKINKKKKNILYLSDQQFNQIITLNTDHVLPATGLNQASIKHYENQIKMESLALRRIAIVGALYGGVIDGLYLFMGAMTLAVLAWPAFIFIFTLSALYSCLNIVFRVSTELEAQRKLDKGEADLRYALSGKALELGFMCLHRLSDPQVATVSEEGRETLQQEIKDDLGKKMQVCEARRQVRDSKTVLSNPKAFFAGVRQGLVVYNTVMSVLFAVASVNAMISAVFPPALLIAAVSSGLIIIIAFAARAMRIQKQKQLKRKNEANLAAPTEKLSQFLEQLKTNIADAKQLTPLQIKADLNGVMQPTEEPSLLIEKWSEIFRLFFSGISKGIRLNPFLFVALQKVDAKGHFRDTPIMFGISVIVSALYAVVFFLREFARTCTKKGIEKMEKVPEVHQKDPKVEVGGGPPLSTEGAEKGGVLNSTGRPSKTRPPSAPPRSAFPLPVPLQSEKTKPSNPNLFFKNSSQKTSQRPRAHSFNGTMSSNLARIAPDLT